VPRRIVVLGSLNQDLVVTVRHLPVPGETVLGQQLSQYPGGKGANQSVAAARLGGQVAMVGRVGNDSFGASLISNLAANGVDRSAVVVDPEAPTGAALIYVQNDGQNMIAVAPGANARLDATDIRRAVEKLEPGDLLVMQLEIPVAVVEQAVSAGRRAGARVLLNAAPAQRLEPGLLSQLDVLVVNEREAQALAGHQTSPQAALDPPEVTTAALRRLGPRIAIVTLGAAGSLVCDESGVHRVEPFQVQAIDATGAGDAFMGALALGLAGGLPAMAAVRFANAAGAAATSKLGAQAALPTLEDLGRHFGLDLSSFAKASQ
jgi:ribokinase